MQELMQKARKTANLTQEQAAKKMFMAKRAYQALEYGEKEMTPDEALKLSKTFDCPVLAMIYCRKKCAIGAAYGFAILNNVDLSIPGILLKLWQEYRKAGEALEKMGCLVINKRSREDFGENERGELEKCLHRLLNLEHNIEILKARLIQLKWLDLRRLVSEHNSKCYQRGYVVDGRQGHAVNFQPLHGGEKDFYERRDSNNDAVLRVEESIVLYRNKPGFPQMVEGTETHLH